MNNWITNPDEVIQGIPEEDRKKFTPEGVDNLKQQTREQLDAFKSKYTEDDLNYHVYLDLSTTYDKYK